jgi:hypothetical protein
LFVLRLWWYLHRFWLTRLSCNHTVEYIMNTLLYIQLVYLLSSLFVCVLFKVFSYNFVARSSSFGHKYPFSIGFFLLFSFFLCFCFVCEYFVVCLFVVVLFFENIVVYTIIYIILTQRTLYILRQPLTVPESDHNNKKYKADFHLKIF